ncbi:MAG: hypothetical protein ACOYL8_05095 [Patescibacteria group bacterium]
MLVESYQEKSEDAKEKESNNLEALFKLVQLNLEKTEEVLKISQDIKNYIKWQRIWSMVRLILIIAPIILGIIYLPSLLKEYIDSFKSLLQ